MVLTLSRSMCQIREWILPNFRPGDMVYLYSYAKGEIPDAAQYSLFGQLA